MKVGIAEAKKRWSELIRAVEGGESVIITRYGHPIAQISQLSVESRKAHLGGSAAGTTQIDLDRSRKNKEASLTK
jgi:prevent-host-death family protein